MADQTDLAPDEHGAEDDLQAVEEVVADDDNAGAARGPALRRADRFDARRRRQRRVHAFSVPPDKNKTQTQINE